MRATTIREARNLAGFFRGGKLNPVMAVALKAGEGGLLTQTATLELDPVAGRLITPVVGEMYVVYAPVQAMIALRDDTDPFAGITEVIRQTYSDGAPIFTMETEGDLSKRMGVMPTSIGGVKQVSTAVRLAHNVAVNFLRQSLYAYATLIDKTNTVVTPALLSSTALDMFNAVLNPDDHVNGLVNLDLTGQMTVPIQRRQAGVPSVAAAAANIETGSGASAPVIIENAANTVGITAFVPLNAFESMAVDMTDASATGFSLTDLANAETMDRMTRLMRDIIKANPVDGEEQVVRWAHGLKVDDAYVPFLLAKRQVIFGQDLLKAMDGAGIEAETTQSRLAQRISLTVPVPTTEMGGVVVTFLVVKPDEVLKEQPHPVLANPWGFDNLVVEELMLDPQPVTARQVQASVDMADEGNVMFYTGYNELRRTYVNYGWNRLVDPETVDSKNSLWQYEIPASVTPENIVYPEDIPHYPFIDQEAEICRYMIASTFVGKSPIFVGPSPVETVSVIDDDDLFGEADD